MIVQTPGVYIKEINTLPPSVAGVSTAIPAFIGFTEMSQSSPVGISNLQEFITHFGGGYAPTFSFTLNATTSEVTDVIPDRRYFLYDSVKLYFLNGGGPCYILSAGTFDSHDSGIVASTVASNLKAQLDKLGTLDDVTVISVPDLHMEYDLGGTLSDLSGEYVDVCNYAMNVCGDLKDKFTILDYPTRNSSAADARAVAPSNGNLKYGATYYPWLKDAASFPVSIKDLGTSITSTSTEKVAYDAIQSDLSQLETAFGSRLTVMQMEDEFNSLKGLIASTNTNAVFSDPLKYVIDLVIKMDEFTPVDSSIIGVKNSLLANNLLIREIKNFLRFKGIAATGTNYISGGASGTGWNLSHSGTIKPSVGWINEPGDTYADYRDVQNDSGLLSTYSKGTKSRADMLDDLASGTLVNLSVIFRAVESLFDAIEYKLNQVEQQLFLADEKYSNTAKAIENYMKIVPTQGAMAGIYCKTDRERGVWKSPANVAVQGVEGPMVEVSNLEQDSLNVDNDSGKSINVIRTFTGKGTLVWGARTLDGNSPEWKYVSVRRFFNFAEESIEKSLKSFVFEPNHPRTWVKIKAMITSFLVNQWQSGALVGTSMNEAFFVKIGEDTTSDADINNGIINVQVGMAVARPAEFIIIEFSHKTK